MTYLRWVFFAFFVCSSVRLQTQSHSCDPSDLLAPKEFARILTNESIIKSRSNNSSCCQWDGVVCGKKGNESVASRVAMLILPKKGLKGIVSRSLGRLDKLKLLDLSSNHFEGVLPVELSNLKQLQVLDLNHNLLSGPVSRVLSGLKMIRSVNVSSNSGDLLEFGGLPNLALFNLFSQRIACGCQIAFGSPSRLFVFVFIFATTLTLGELLLRPVKQGIEKAH
ncbi:hypothetical protein Ddye_026772 [Dipteronia dyeriana]|uniref:Leucine-rich repeat-containing N-terminal plant-type domain-containing protein n=1 Tax=Dipteronia dyeriana TaxID=168575 RepID=A0AAD9TMT0_9ROSI|nr:hypothetical protein Ddye_026772 [Dipteronia dyeriana]